MTFGPQQLSEWMIGLGYTPKRTPPNFEQAFVSQVQSVFGPVTVRIVDIHEGFMPYPKVYIIDLPSNLEDSFLPHLNHDQSLCYLDKETTSLWIIDPETALATFVEAIKARIQEWSKDNIIYRDFQQELTSYWNGEYDVFDISSDRKVGVYTFYKRDSIRGEEETEVVLAYSGQAEH